MMYKLTVLSLVVLAAGALVLTGCGGGGSSNLSGTGRLQLSLVDAPLNADAINVVITSVDVHSSERGWQTIRTFEPALAVDLLDYSTSGDRLLLADTPLAAGHYTMVRLNLSSAEVVIGGQPHEVDLSNVAQTGVKANGQFTVDDGQLIALILDFNAAKSIVNNPPGSSNYKLHPVMIMSPVNVATEVTGTVEFTNAQDQPVAVPEGATVDVYTAGHAGEAEFLISGSEIDTTNGTFDISVLPAGTYDLVVAVNGVAAKTLTGVTVSPPTTDLGTITVKLQ